jgi:hypothetical protein
VEGIRVSTHRAVRAVPSRSTGTHQALPLAQAGLVYRTHRLWRHPGSTPAPAGHGPGRAGRHRRSPAGRPAVPAARVPDIRFGTAAGERKQSASWLSSAYQGVKPDGRLLSLPRDRSPARSVRGRVPSGARAPGLDPGGARRPGRHAGRMQRRRPDQRTGVGRQRCRAGPGGWLHVPAHRGPSRCGEPDHSRPRHHTIEPTSGAASSCSSTTGAVTALDRYPGHAGTAQPPDHRPDRGRVVSEAEPGDHRAVRVQQAGNVNVRCPVDPRNNALHHSPPCLIDPEGPPEAGAGAGRSLQGARSAWPYSQSQRRAAGSCRTPIGPRRASISSSDPAATGHAPASSRAPAPSIVDQ